MMISSLSVGDINSELATNCHSLLGTAYGGTSPVPDDDIIPQAPFSMSIEVAMHQQLCSGRNQIALVVDFQLLLLLTVSDSS